MSFYHCPCCGRYHAEKDGPLGIAERRIAEIEGELQLANDIRQVAERANEELKKRLAEAQEEIAHRKWCQACAEGCCEEYPLEGEK